MVGFRGEGLCFPARRGQTEWDGAGHYRRHVRLLLVVVVLPVVCEQHLRRDVQIEQFESLVPHHSGLRVLGALGEGGALRKDTRGGQSLCAIGMK